MHVQIRRSARVVTALFIAVAVQAIAQGVYPSKPIKIIAPVQPGGGVDLVARQIGDRLGKALGQPDVVENQSGGGGVVGSLATARAAPDGYTLMVGYVGTHGTNPAVRKMPYDAIKDFTPIAMVGGTPYILVVPPGVPANNLREFIARLNDKINRMLESADLRERLSGEALEPMPMTPEQFGSYIRDDVARWSRLAKDRNIQISE
jgi:tripartite-type tricarboxylate transporter receptor subunit TctC